MTDFPLFPDQASTIARDIDYLYYFLVGMSGFFSMLIFGLIIYFAIRYREREGIDRLPPAPGKAVILEVVWSVVPLVLVMATFALGASLYFGNSRAPAGAMDIYVVGKQWMWKIQHPEGKREINELHVPVGRPVKLTLASEDVIHSFYVPAFRVKQDVVPGRFQTMWFEATQTGTYHLFCAEYCGTQHSRMVGSVFVMDPEDFQQWLEAEAVREAVAPPATPAEVERQAFIDGATPAALEGERLFSELNCADCHGPERSLGPRLAGRFGQTVALGSGQSVVFDENYFRRALLDPGAELSAGFRPVMPTYQGQVTEEEMLQLMAYIQSMEAGPVP